MISPKKYDFAAGEVLLVDKPLNWTSFQVVNKLRYPLKKLYKKKRFKVGHAGTLDPLATGLLVICTGKMTKSINGFVQDAKVYTGIIKLGATTPSFDLETEIDKTYPVDHITPGRVEEVRKQFLGEQEQVPPVFSAKQIDGKRAYEYAREGKEVKMRVAQICIHELELDFKNGDELHFEVNCSKGTYIRSLANDIGKALNSGGHLIELRRTQSGDFNIKDAKSVEEWVKIIKSTQLENL
ncbi:tRNA pseudouridine(55) synthase TruB [Parvicella tangerina]|uniref:tRNA pseudouridine synthase B n=1 Tax=Parvicella tangerina TaxID=2829795 RepID=A0A916JPL0_9FLAO|nr:tRNA pseudouridine(55) synthase TruB [Parvicella tangerina]CAG5085179.1 tRNA pseudouridine synthase B [Parvicella tangerina]